MTGVRHPLAFSKDGHTLAALTRDGGAVVFMNLATGEPEQQFELENKRGRFGPFGPGAFSSSVALSDDLRTLACAQDDGTVRLWDTATRESTTLKVSDGPAELLALSPDGHGLLTRGRDWVVRRWDLRAGTNIAWRTEAFRVLLSPDGRLMASAGRSNVVQLWDATSLALRAKLECEESPGSGFGGFTATFSADGRLIAIVYQDDAIRLWDTTTGQLLGTCIGHKQAVRSVAFSPDAQTLATASDDSTLKLWNIATQQELLTVRQLGATLSGLLFSPDGRMLVGGSGAFSQSGGIRLFRAPLFRETDVAKVPANLEAASP